MKIVSVLVILSFHFSLIGSVVTKKKEHERPHIKAIEGDTISLSCDRGSVTTETLYAVKWYKDEKEFFRNYPKAETPVKVYPIDGFKLQLPLPSPWQVVLQNVNASATGKYTCMVVDYPRYRTIYKSTQVDITSRNETLHQSHQPHNPRKLNSNDATTSRLCVLFIPLILTLPLLSPQ